MEYVSRAQVIEIKPTKEQQVKLNRMFLQTQALYHWALETNQRMYTDWKEDNSNEYPSYVSMSREYTKVKPECANLLPRSTAARVIRNMCTAVTNHLKNPEHFKLPDFTKKRDVKKYTMYVDNAHSYVKQKKVYFPKVGLIKMTENLRWTEEPKAYNFKWYAGKYWVIIQFSIPKPILCSNDSVAGVDVGLKHIAVTSDNVVLDYPASADKARASIKRQQRILSRKQEGSNNYNKQLTKLQRAQLKRENILHDVNHKFTTNLCKTHAIIAMEDLHLSELTEKSPHYMRAKFAESQMKQIHFMLDYKATRAIHCDRYFASSKTCYHCGNKKEDLTLNDRTYTCEACGFSIDRDLNAALNLKNYAVGLVKPDQINF